MDWETVPEFRKWLAYEPAYSGDNRRFDYAAEYHEAYIFPNAEPFDLTAESVDGHLFQSGVEIHFGSFEVDSLLDRLEASEDREAIGEYEGYVIVDGGIAVDEDVIVWDHVREDPVHRLDVRHGEGGRLEELDPEATRLFETLPDGTHLAGQYGSNAGGRVDVDGHYLWGIAFVGVDPMERTWVFIFEDEDDLTEDVLVELEEIAGNVLESKMDGRIATVTGSSGV